MSARDAILASIREAISGAPAAPAPSRDYRFSSGKSAAELKEQLIDRLVDYKANVIEVSTEAEIPDAVTQRLASAARVVVPTGLSETLVAGLSAEIVPDTAEAPLSVADLDAIDAVVTESAAACSETGTIILDASPNQGRRAISLVPDHHVCIVRMENVRGLLPETLAIVDTTRPLTWISGPSATSDIELERVEGVHGPRTLDVILVG